MVIEQAEAVSLNADSDFRVLGQESEVPWSVGAVEGIRDCFRFAYAVLAIEV